MLLVGAFVLAVMFVALALVVNSAIYTENLASRNHAGGAEDALQARATVEGGVGEAIAAANVYNNSDWTTLSDNVTVAVETIETITAREYAADGRFLSLNVTGIEEGTRIADNASGGSTFVGSSGAENWTVTTTSPLRDFVLEIDHDDVVSGGDSFGGRVIDEFYLRVTDGTDTWRVNVTERSGDFVVGVAPPGGNGGTCTVTGSPDSVRIDLTAGAVAGRDCPAMTFGEGVGSSYDVAFNESNQVRGNYSLVVARDGYSNTELEAGPGAGAPGDPYTDLAVYATDLRYRYDAPAVAYETDVRVAPGEPG